MNQQGPAHSEVSKEQVFLTSANSREPHTLVSLWQRHCHFCHKLSPSLSVSSYRDTGNVRLRAHPIAISPRLNTRIAVSSVLFHMHRDQGLRCQCILVENGDTKQPGQPGYLHFPERELHETNKSLLLIKAMFFKPSLYTGFLPGVGRRCTKKCKG